MVRNVKNVFVEKEENNNEHMVKVPEHVRAVIDTLPPGMKKAHEAVINELRVAAESGRRVVIFADRDPDGASAHGLADIARHLGVKRVDVYHVNRDDIRFKEPTTYVVYDISVTHKQLGDVHPDAKIINIDHHDLVPKGGFPEHPQLVAISNPFYTDRPREKLNREENNQLYPLNPSVQLLHIAALAEYDPKKIAILSAVGAVGDRAHQYSDTIKRFVEVEARANGPTVEDLEKIAGVFELVERFPNKITTNEIVQKYLNAVGSGQPAAILVDEKIRQLNEDWEHVLSKYLKRIDDGEYLAKEMPISGGTVKIVVMHVGPEDEKRIQKIKSAIGSALLDKFKNAKEPVVVAAGQWEPGDVMNYRIGVNPAGQDIGLHAGAIANALASKFGMAGGGHAAVAGAKIPYAERERALEHISEAVRRALGSS